MSVSHYQKSRNTPEQALKIPSKWGPEIQSQSCPWEVWNDEEEEEEGNCDDLKSKVNYHPFLTLNLRHLVDKPENLSLLDDLNNLDLCEAFSIHKNDVTSVGLKSKQNNTYYKQIGFVQNINTS